MGRNLFIQPAIASAWLIAARAGALCQQDHLLCPGFGLLRLASQEYNYDLNFGEIARIWRAGCIIRASLLSDITAAFERNPDLANLLLDDAFRQAVDRPRRLPGAKWCSSAIGLGIPVLAPPPRWLISMPIAASACPPT